MFETKKHIFWQSFLVALLIFFCGIVLGFYFEQVRNDKVGIISYESEISLFDSLTFVNLPITDSSKLGEQNLEFANRIYDEARELEKYDGSTKMTDSLKLVHKRYDLLRTLLWINTIKIREKNSSINDIVYFYIYDTQDAEIRARQTTFSKVLMELKEKRGSDFVLIPVAADSELSSLNSLMDYYKIKNVPAILVNEEHLIENVITLEELEEYLK